MPTRYTYCSLTSPRPQIRCFTEASGVDEQIKSSATALDNGASPIIHIDILRATTQDEVNQFTQKLLAVHENGGLTCFSDNVETPGQPAVLRQDSTVQLLDGDVQVQLAAVISVKQARRTLLKNRDDILALLDAGPSGSLNSLLVLLSRTTAEEAAGGDGLLTLSIYNFILLEDSASHSTKTRVPKLLSVPLPSPKPQLRSSMFSLDASSGVLHQLWEDNWSTYNLAFSSPRLTHELHLEHPVFSCLQITPDLLGYCSRGNLSIVDSTYHSLQCSFDFPKSKAQAGEPETSIQPAAEERLRLLSYFAPLGSVLILRGRKLVVIQLSIADELPQTSRKRKRNNALATSIGRGSSLHRKPCINAQSAGQVKTLGNFLKSTSVSSQHEKTELDPTSSKFDPGQFERAVASAGRMHKGQRMGATIQKNSNLLGEDSALSQLLSRCIGVDRSSDKSHISTNNNVVGLKFHHLTRRLCEVFIETGVLTTYHIEMFLKHHNNLAFTESLAPGAFIQAIVDWDPSLDLIYMMLNSSLPLKLSELVRVLAIIIRTIENTEVTQRTMLLTNGELNVSDDTLKAERGVSTNVDSLNGRPWSHSHDDSNPHTSHLLQSTLRRLYATSSSILAKALKAEMSTYELRLLVDTLRMEIARSGWLSPYEESLHVDSEVKDHNQILYIAHLFGSVIDSIGTGGWIVSSSLREDLSETADTIAYMRAEISAALEGIEEATYLRGMLGEILLCGKNLLRSIPKARQQDQAHLTLLPIKPVTVPFDEENESFLPLGLKPALPVSTTRVGAGGELIRRSKRDIGRLKSKAVGKYSFERISV